THVSGCAPVETIVDNSTIVLAFRQRARGVERRGGARGEEGAGEGRRDRDGDAEEDVRRAEVEEGLRLEGEIGKRTARKTIDEKAAQARQNQAERAADDPRERR